MLDPYLVFYVTLFWVALLIAGVAGIVVKYFLRHK
jgi:hypothetical protein